MKVKVLTITEYLVDLPIDSFDDICTESMSLDESDKLIIDCIYDQFGLSINAITDVRECKINTK